MPDPIPLNTAKRRQRGAKSDLPEVEPSCPITPLGHNDGVFWFLNIVGERRKLSARQLGIRTELTALFLGDMEWLLSPRFRSLDESGNVTGFKVNKVGEYLMNACRQAGLYGDHIVVRRGGVWAGEAGMPIAHCGDALFVDGEKLAPGARIAGQIFATSPREAYPDEKPAPAAVAQQIAEDMRTLWNLRDDGAEIIAIGVIGQAFYAAALSWRANVFLCGPSMSGKSEFLALMRAMTPMHHYTTDTTAAGIQGAINGRAMPAFIDEASDRSGVQNGGSVLIDIVLSASSGTGTKGYRGTADGGVRAIEVVSSVIMASVSPPAMQPQHRSRFSIIELEKPGNGADNRAAMKAAQARAALEAGGIFARALAGFGRYKSALATFRHTLALNGCVAREMDQLGSILAGAWVLMWDGEPDDAAAMDIAKMILPFIRGGDEMEQDDAPQIVLSKLLSHVVSLDRSTDQESLARVIRNAMATDAELGENRRQAMRVLERWGIRVMRETDILDVRKRVLPRLSPGNGLWIDTRVEPLRRIFMDSPYQGDRWIYELMRLPGSQRSRHTVRVGSLQPSKAIWLRWTDSNDEEEDTS